MSPLQAGGSRLWRAVQRIREWSLTAGLGVSLVLGGLLGHSSLATAQPVGPANDPAFFAATGYRIGSPTALIYFQQRGKRVQIFQRQMLEIDQDGTVTPATILDPAVLPIAHIDGLNLPTPDADLVGSAPTPASPDYAA